MNKKQVTLEQDRYSSLHDYACSYIINNIVLGDPESSVNNQLKASGIELQMNQSEFYLMLCGLTEGFLMSLMEVDEQSAIQLNTQVTGEARIKLKEIGFVDYFVELFYYMPTRQPALIISPKRGKKQRTIEDVAVVIHQMMDYTYKDFLPDNLKNTKIFSALSLKQTQFGKPVKTAMDELVRNLNTQRFFIWHETVIIEDDDPYIPDVSPEFIFSMINRIRKNLLEGNASRLESTLLKLFIQRMVLAGQKKPCTQVMLILREMHDEICSTYNITPYPREIFDINRYEFLEYAYTEILKVFLDLCSQIDKSLSSIDPLVRKAIIYIYENYNKNLSLETISDHVEFKKAYFGMKFKEEMNCTFLEYISKVRLDTVIVLLVCTDLPIALVARTVGMEDLKYFISWFRKSKGMSPLDYREKEKEN